MRIGIDLDNTIVSYDALFHLVAVERGLVPRDLLARKNAVKNFVQSSHGADAWTRLQAEVYGPQMHRAAPFPGVADFFRRCRLAGISTCILSHKSRYPALGEPHDLRVAALDWLEQKGWFDPHGVGLSPEAVEFHDTRAEKIAAIRAHRCDVFVDDLPEVLAHPEFPTATARILFDPERIHTRPPHWSAAASWAEIEQLLFVAKKTA